MNKQSII